MERFADFVLRFRWPILILTLLVTAFFGWQATYVKFDTVLSGLWPDAHEYIKTHRAHERYYGSPLTVYIMLQRKDGTIYNPETLEKIDRITKAVDAIRGVNHNRVVSISSRKVKKITLSGSNIRTDNLYPLTPPKTPEELREFETNVARAGVLGTLASFDRTSSLISANFLPDRSSIQEIFARVQEIKDREQDKQHEILLAGEPILMGWVQTYQREIVVITGVSLTLMFLVLYGYVRNLRLSLLPMLATFVSTVWGLGFAGFLRLTLDPLILIIPALLMARTLSHGVQKVERIIELEAQELDAHGKARALIMALFGSGMLGIVTDALGILVIALATIPIMQELAYFCSFWAASAIISVLIFIPVVVAIIGVPEQAQVLQRLERGWATRILTSLGRVVSGAHARWVTAVFIVVSIAAFAYSSRIGIGDVHAGTSLLWPDSPFNMAVDNINRKFYGTDEFFIIATPQLTEQELIAARKGAEVAEEKVVDDRALAGSGVKPSYDTSATEEDHEIAQATLKEFLGMRRVDVLLSVEQFQRYLERHPLVRQTFSFADFMPTMNRVIHGNHAKWDYIPEDDRAAANFAYALLKGTDPGDFDRFVHDAYKHANVMAWLVDHRGETLEEVVGYIKDYNSTLPVDSPVDFQLASGFAGVKAAVNEEVERKELAIFLVAVSIVGIACMITFRSVLAAIVLMVPLIVTNFIVMSIMVLMEIGLDVNTLPIVSIGMGVGIDYGIYMLTRILQEYRRTEDYSVACAIAIRTTGRAIFFTATIMVVSVGIWYFLSSFRFMAEMGFLLALVMGVNMLGALVVIPALITVTRPKFALTARLLVWD